MLTACMSSAHKNGAARSFGFRRAILSDAMTRTERNELIGAWIFATVAWKAGLDPEQVALSICEQDEWSTFWIDGSLPTCCKADDDPYAFYETPVPPCHEPRSAPLPDIKPHYPNLPNGGWMAKRHSTGNAGHG